MPPPIIGIPESRRLNPLALLDKTSQSGSTTDPGLAAIVGFNPGSKSVGVIASEDLVFNQHVGVYGESDQQGVMGLTTVDGGTGVYGGGAKNPGDAGAGCIGVRGETFSGVGVQGQSFGTGQAGKFIGDVQVTGNLTAQDCQFRNINASVDITLSGADCAEDFEVASGEHIAPGSVMVIDEDGALRQCSQAYDKRVAGVISGAGDLKPGIILGKDRSPGERMPVALIGTVYCKVDAQYSPVDVGDLLTSSPTLGHAMKAHDPLKAFGSVIGKALRPFKQGQGLIPILIALQ
jgi:hypothetical protein